WKNANRCNLAQYSAPRKLTFVTRTVERRRALDKPRSSDFFHRHHRSILELVPPNFRHACMRCIGSIPISPAPDLRDNEEQRLNAINFSHFGKAQTAVQSASNPACAAMINDLWYKNA